MAVPPGLAKNKKWFLLCVAAFLGMRTRFLMTDMKVFRMDYIHARIMPVYASVYNSGGNSTTDEKTSITSTPTANDISETHSLLMQGYSELPAARSPEMPEPKSLRPIQRQNRFQLDQHKATATVRRNGLLRKAPRQREAKSHQNNDYFTVTFSNCTVNPKSVTNFCRDTDGVLRLIERNNYAMAQNTESFTQTYPTHRSIEKCLANKHIVFIGDSRVRFQYLNLADFLDQERWTHCQEFLSTDPPSDDSCFLLGDRQEGGRNGTEWATWFSQSNRKLQSSKQRELCACRRDKPFDRERTMENRYLRRYTKYGTIQLTYVQNFVGTVNFHKDFPPFSRPQQTCSAGDCDNSEESLRTYNMSYGLKTIIPQLHPTHVVMINGWEHPEMSCLLKRWSQHTNIDATLITHPAMRGQQVVEPRRVSFQCPDVPILNRQEISVGAPPELYWDGLHSLSTLNREYNYKLIEKLCEEDQPDNAAASKRS